MRFVLIFVCLFLLSFFFNFYDYVMYILHLFKSRTCAAKWFIDGQNISV